MIPKTRIIAPFLKHSLVLFVIPLAAGLASGQEKAPAAPFRTFLETRSMAHERLLPYLEAARPEIVQIGHFGAMFHGLADSEKSRGTPMQLPFAGERKFLEFQRDLYRKIHGLGLKAVGHFTLIKAYGDWEERSGFIDYYDHRWPEDLLGPKPHPDLRELLQRSADGRPIQTSRYEQAQIAFCLSSPPARQMFKQMLKRAIDDGADGVITNYNYHFECACPHCQAGFKTWLAARLTPAEIKSRLGVEHLETHRFATIPAAISGYPDPATASPLHWLAMRWAAENFQSRFSEIFIEYGRSLKPDLIVAQWNHLGHAGTGNERMFLPAARWGLGEDYFWESGGASFVGKNLDLGAGKAGDAWLSCLLTRELAGGKPFVMGKYDGIRLAANVAEGYATGGLGMGRYARFEEAEGFETLVRYTQFMHRHRDLYDGAAPLVEAALVLPRLTAREGRPGAWDDFRSLGQALLNDQALIEVLADENLSRERLARCPAVIIPAGTEFTEAQSSALRHYQETGGRVIRHETTPDVVAALRETGASVIEAPWTLRAAAWKKGDRVLLHLVNYDRDEGQTREEKASKPRNERPRPVRELGIDLRFASQRPVSAVRMHRPESGAAVDLPFTRQGDRLQFRVPEMLVYAVIEMVP